MLQLSKFSFGVGDRFALQAKAQLRACMLAAEQGAEVIPVWNKSNREHLTVGSDPCSVRAAAEAAVRELGWTKPYHVDADHIRLDTVDRFLSHSDFFTLDVADEIGKPSDEARVRDFIRRHPELAGTIRIDGIDGTFELSAGDLERIAGKYLRPVEAAGAIHRHIAANKGEGRFITEVSMDETEAPQTPPELLIILAAIADERIPVQTIAPKFTGRFNKGVDYQGDLARFEKEFSEDLAVVAHAVKTYGLPGTLKLSVHSGSDKFSLYAPIRKALARAGAGVHLKTAGTTWLEELIGLAEADGECLELAREIYAEALSGIDALCAPYAAVIDIDRNQLPATDVVRGWTAAEFTGALRHDPKNPLFNPHLRQLLHVGYKVAAHMHERYTGMVRACEEVVARNVTANLFERHLKPLFLEF